MAIKKQIISQTKCQLLHSQKIAQEAKLVRPYLYSISFGIVRGGGIRRIQRIAATQTAAGFALAPEAAIRLAGVARVARAAVHRGPRVARLRVGRAGLAEGDRDRGGRFGRLLAQIAERFPQRRRAEGNARRPPPRRLFRRVHRLGLRG